jgi:muconate cycloisomerase
VRVVELTAHQVRIRLKREIRHASHARTETDNLLVHCKLADGTEGYGEGVPRDYVTGETIDADFGLLQTADWQGQLEECRDFPAVFEMLERFQFSEVPGDDRRCRANAARCALELSILDAYGRHFGQPVSDVTRIVAPELYRPVERVRYSGAITTARRVKLRLASWGMRLYGFQQMKIKVGVAGQNDIERLRLARRCLGRKMDIRIDANEAWTPAEAANKIGELEPFGITSVEQPVRHADQGALAGIRKKIKTPIMLDESLCSMVDAERAVANQSCDLFNIRLSKCGGFLASLRLAQYAQRYGLGYQLGCQVGETGILSAAGRHFAQSVAGIRYLEGSYDRHLVRTPLTTGDLTFGRGGRAPALTGPGLGASVDPDAVKQVSVRMESLLG